MNRKSGLAEANGIHIWYETFGDKKHPALLLIMGACCQGILWPTEFCEQLASAGFFVIRYDHRDAGYSSYFDFDETPYDCLDMAKDAIGLLDFLEIRQAHLFGLSVGGAIAQLLAVHYSYRIFTIAIMASSLDFSLLRLAIENQPISYNRLSYPKEEFLSWMKGLFYVIPQTLEEKVEQRLEGWHIMNGFVIPFEESRYREIHREFLSRLKYPQGLRNHYLMSYRSEHLISTVPYHVRVPTLVFHGSEDPIFPPDHGDALAKAICGCKYLFVKGMGHVPNSHFYPLMIQALKENASHIF